MNIRIGRESIAIIDEANPDRGADELISRNGHAIVGAAKTDARKCRGGDAIAQERAIGNPQGIDSRTSGIAEKIVPINNQPGIVAGASRSDEQGIVYGMSSELVVENAKVDTG